MFLARLKIYGHKNYLTKYTAIFSGQREYTRTIKHVYIYINCKYVHRASISTYGSTYQ